MMIKINISITAGIQNHQKGTILKRAQFHQRDHIVRRNMNLLSNIIAESPLNHPKGYVVRKILSPQKRKKKEKSQNPLDSNIDKRTQNLQRVAMDITGSLGLHLLKVIHLMKEGIFFLLLFIF